MVKVLAVACLLIGASCALAQTETTLAVADMAFGTGYDYAQRQVVGEATTFPAGTEHIFCATRLTGATTPTEITHAWYHEGKTMAKVTLAVASSDWRTVSSKTLLPAWTGNWEVQVLDAAGNVLKTMSFTVE